MSSLLRLVSDSRGGQPNIVVAKVRKARNENGRQPMAVALCFNPTRRSSVLDGVPVSDSTQRVRCSEWLSLVDKTSCLRLKKKTATAQCSTEN